jgi:4-amino-4-deoxy-L-arabinose transferase-like glycosyltransferase
LEGKGKPGFITAWAIVSKSGSERMKKFVSEIKDGPRGWLVLLLLAGALHVVTTTTVFLVGRFGLMPSQFDSHGLGKFASDSFLYHDDIVSLTDKLRNQGAVAWLQAVAPLHVKSYGLSHFLFGRWFEPNVLTIEPANLIYYLAILALVYKLGKTIFDRRAGIMAMAVAALWPSFLVHTTQLLRDPLLIVAILVFVLILCSWLIKDHSLRWSLSATIPVCIAVATIWIVRLAMWDAVRGIVVTACVLLIVRHLREKRILAGPIVMALVLVGWILIVPHWEPLKSLQRREADVGRTLLAEQVAGLTIWERIGRRRQAFVDLKNDKTSSAASNVDEEITFDTFSDLVRYLPRAAALGFFAPFPNMWFERGSQVGRAGRLLSGCETLATYLIELATLISLWRMRRNLAVWLLTLTVFLGLVGLGLIVVNIGSLYRFRYPFLMLMFVLAAGGAREILRHRAQRREAARSSLHDLQSSVVGTLSS